MQSGGLLHCLAARAKTACPGPLYGPHSRAWTLRRKDGSVAVSGIEQRFVGSPASSLVVVLSCYVNVVQDFHIWTWLHFLCFRRLKVLPTTTVVCTPSNL